MLQAMRESIRKEQIEQLSTKIRDSVANISETIHQFTMLGLVRYVPVSMWVLHTVVLNFAANHIV